ncbi:MAG: hypothetical protein KDD32_02715 [Bacteroidetes bacterium]|nr:hypothetical protein [Bacteroidota bacterium]
MYPFKDEMVSIVISDQYQRKFLEDRLLIPSDEEDVPFLEWCQRSKFSDALVVELVLLFSDPTYKPDDSFSDISIEEILLYIKESHQFYNHHYLKKLEQLNTVHHNIIDTSNKTNTICILMNQFISYFRKHIIEEETQLIPYIEFILLDQAKHLFRPSELFAVLCENQTALYNEHDDHGKQLLKLIQYKLQQLSLQISNYDFQWSYYCHLINTFFVDLTIHEYIEDNILLSKARQHEQIALEKIRVQCRLN